MSCDLQCPSCLLWASVLYPVRHVTWSRISMLPTNKVPEFQRPVGLVFCRRWWDGKGLNPTTKIIDIIETVRWWIEVISTWLTLQEIQAGAKSSNVNFSRAMLVSGRVYMDPPIITTGSATDKLLNPRGHAARRKHVRFSIACALLSGRRGRARGGAAIGSSKSDSAGSTGEALCNPKFQLFGFHIKVTTHIYHGTRYKNGKDARIRREMKSPGGGGEHGCILRKVMIWGGGMYKQLIKMLQLEFIDSNSIHRAFCPVKQRLL